MARKRSRRITVEDVAYVHKNFAGMTAAELASARKISLYQVNKIVSDLRKSGVELPKKKPRRKDPVKDYVAGLGLKTVRKKAKPVRKKTGRKTKKAKK